MPKEAGLLVKSQTCSKIMEDTDLEQVLIFYRTKGKPYALILYLRVKRANAEIQNIADA